MRPMTLLAALVTSLFINAAMGPLAVPMQITVEKWTAKTGADLVYVPVRGGADMVSGLLAGTTPASIVGLPNFISHIHNGTVAALAVDSENRSPLFPDVPTLQELG